MNTSKRNWALEPTKEIVFGACESFPDGYNSQKRLLKPKLMPKQRLEEFDTPMKVVVPVTH